MLMHQRMKVMIFWIILIICIVCLASSMFYYLPRLSSVAKLIKKNKCPAVVICLCICVLHPNSAESSRNISYVRDWRRQTTIPMCLRTTQPWSTTSRERAPWLAASVPSLRAAQTETKTTTTSTTGDHVSRNWPTCTTHAEVAGASENRGWCLGH